MNSLLVLTVAQALTFNEALTKIAAQSTAVKEARVTEESAKYQDDHAGYAYAPGVNAFGQIKRQGDDVEDSRMSEARSVGVGAELNLYRFGADAAKANQAEANYKAATHARQATVTDAEVEAAAALFDLIEALETRRVAEGVVTIQRDNVKVIRRLYERGARPAQDTEKVDIDAANAAARLTDAEITIEAARSAIVRLSGEAVDVRSEWPWRERLLKDDGAVAAKLAGMDVQMRPERQALAARLTALDAGLTSARAKYLPSLDLSADYAFVKPTRPEPREQFAQWSGALTLSVPLFDGFSSRVAYEEQAKAKQIAELDLVALDRALGSELTQVKAAFAASLKSAKAREVALKSAKALYEHSLKGFRSGVLSANDLNLDQGRVYDTELNALRGWSAVHRYLAKLCRVSGRPLTACVP